MGYLLNIVIAVAALGLPELGVTSADEHLWAVLAFALVPVLIGVGLRRLVLRGRFRAAEIVARILAASPALLFAAAIAQLGWIRTTERWMGASAAVLEWPRPSLLVVIAPFLVYQLLAIDARARAQSSSASLRRARAFQVRMFLSSLAPIAIYLGVSMLIGLSPSLRVRIEEVALWNGLYAAGLMLVLGLCLPFVLRNTWDTVPLPAGDLRAVMELVARRAGFRARELLVWRTGFSMSNAAIVGFGARTRVVLFSDLLLTQLELRELAAVFAHEMGHAVRRHVLVFVTVALAILLTLEWVATDLLGDQVWLGGGIVLAGLVGGYFVFGWLSRRCELEADLYSANLLGDTSAIVDALEKVGGDFRDVASWRHFSTARRVAFLRRAAADPSIARKLVRGIRVATIVALVWCALALGVRLVRDVPLVGEQSFRAELRLGRYAQAAEHAVALEGLDAAARRLGERARELGGAEVAVEELERRARAALEQHDAEGAYDWLALAVLRGRDPLGRVALAVRAIAEAQAIDVAAELGPELEPTWGALVRDLRR